MSYINEFIMCSTVKHTLDQRRGQSRTVAEVRRRGS